VLVASRFGSAEPEFGTGSELDVITAVILGGVAFSGGEGTIGGMLLGALFLGELNSGFIALNISPYYADLVKGLALIAAVGVDQIVHEQREHFRKTMAMREDRGADRLPFLEAFRGAVRSATRALERR
jgi:ribose transport system permease protein